MLRQIVDSIKQLQAPKPYTFEWFRALSDDELDAEHEKARLRYLQLDRNCSFREACEVDNILYKFIKEGERRLNPSDIGFPIVHSEHGWHLPDKD